MISAISSSTGLAAYPAAQTDQTKTPLEPQPQPQPKLDTVHIHSAVTGKVDNDGDSH